MNLVLTMAGKYQRFRLFGNKVPKYLMPLGKTTVLWHVLNALHSVDSDINIYLLANDSDRDFFPIIKSVMKDFSISQKNIGYISDTKSQLDTAMHIFDVFQELGQDSDSPIAFTSIDTILRHRRCFFDGLAKLGPTSGLIDVFPGSSHDYSYILPEGNGASNVREIADYHCLSDMACSGLYSFGSVSFFKKNCQSFLKNNKAGNFTSFYSTLLESGYAIHYSHASDVRDTLVLGTPEEYIVNLHRFS